MDYLQYFYSITKIFIIVINCVLNLIINGLPSILAKPQNICFIFGVLNLIINGLPSILSKVRVHIFLLLVCFKPYYKWITFNTWSNSISIFGNFFHCFKPYYKWITFNTLTKGMNHVFMLERSLFYMVAKFEHFSVIHGFLTFYIKFLLQFFYFFLK